MVRADLIGGRIMLEAVPAATPLAESPRQGVPGRSSSTAFPDRWLADCVGAGCFSDAVRLQPADQPNSQIGRTTGRGSSVRTVHDLIVSALLGLGAWQMGRGARGVLGTQWTHVGPQAQIEPCPVFESSDAPPGLSMGCTFSAAPDPAGSVTVAPCRVLIQLSRMTCCSPRAPPSDATFQTVPMLFV